MFLQIILVGLNVFSTSSLYVPRKFCLEQHFSGGRKNIMMYPINGVLCLVWRIGWSPLSVQRIKVLHHIKSLHWRRHGELKSEFFEPPGIIEVAVNRFGEGEMKKEYTDWSHENQLDAPLIYTFANFIYLCPLFEIP